MSIQRAHNTTKSNYLKLIKRGAYLLSAFLIVALVIIAGILIFVDPNLYKARIEQLARDKANIELSIAGEMQWSLYPWLGISVKETQVSALNEPDNPVASVDEFVLSLKLIPLIMGDIEIDQLHIDGLNLTLMTYADGSQNIDGFFQKHNSHTVKSHSTQQISSDLTPQTELAKTQPKDRRLNISAININNAQFHLEDQIKQITIAGNHIDFSLKNLQANTPDFSVEKLHFNHGNLSYKNAFEGNSYVYNEINFSLQNFIIDQDNTDLERNISLALKQLKIDGGTFTLNHEKSGQSFYFNTALLDAQNLQYTSHSQDDRSPWNMDHLNIHDFSVRYHESHSNSDLILEKGDVSIQNFHNHADTPITFSAIIKKTDEIDLALQGKAQLKLNPESSTIELSQMQIDTEIALLPEITPPSPIQVNIAGDIQINPRNETIIWQKPILSINQINLLESFKLTGFHQDTMQIDASTNIQQLNLQSFLQAIGKPILPLENPQSLTDISINTGIIYQANALSISPITLHLDGSQFTGSLHLTDLSQKIGSVAMRGDMLNLNNYLPKTSESTTSLKSASKIDTANNVAHQKIGNQNEAFFENLADMHLKVEVDLQALLYDQLSAKSLFFKADILDKTIQIHQLNMQALGGHISLNAGINGAQASPIIESHVNIDTVSLTKLFALLQQQIPITGNLNLTGDFSTQGQNIKEMMNHLSGQFSANVRQGTLIGVNYEQLACEGLSMIAKNYFDKKQTTQSTSFTTLQASATFNNGIMRNQDLNIVIPGLSATGYGTINLPKEQLDYFITLKANDVTSIPHCQIDRYLKNVTIPLRCNGSLTNNAGSLCVIDQQKIGQIIADAAKNKLEETLKGKIKEALPPALQKQQSPNKSRDEIKPKDLFKAFEGLLK